MLSFGEQEHGKEEDQASSEEAPAGGGSTRGQKLWAVLLVLDSFFVIVFGGTLAAKVYQHWQAPLATAVVTTRRTVKQPEPPKAPEPAKAPEAAPTPPPEAKAPEPPKAPPPAKAAPAKSVVPSRPSLLQEPPKAHQPPAPQKPSHEAPAKTPPAPPAAQPSADGKKKAAAVDFQFSAPGAKRVQLIGAFIVRGGRKDMVKSSDGLWTLRLYLTPNTYRYHFVVDGKKKLDPNSAEADSRNSIITVP